MPWCFRQNVHRLSFWGRACERDVQSIGRNRLGVGGRAERRRRERNRQLLLSGAGVLRESGRHHLYRRQRRRRRPGDRLGRRQHRFWLDRRRSQGQLYVGDDTGVGTITQNGANSTVTLESSISRNSAATPPTSAPGGTGTYNLIAGTFEVGGAGRRVRHGRCRTGNAQPERRRADARAPIIIGNSGTGAYNMSGGVAGSLAGLIIGDLADRSAP